MIGTVRSNNKFQYIKRQDICGISNNDFKSKSTASMDNLAFTEDQVLEDKLFIKMTIKDSGENGT